MLQWGEKYQSLVLYAANFKKYPAVFLKISDVIIVGRIIKSITDL
jgi:hypothetical protein